MIDADLLLDSHVFLWWNLDADRFSPRMIELISDPTRRVFLSAASIWEIAIKPENGRLGFSGSLIGSARDHGFAILAIEAEDAEQAARLPKLHRDPFDRMLVAQAIRNRLTLVTADREIGRYAVALLPPDGAPGS